MPQPWNDYYHVMWSPYGQWLRGDERGWRERHHREHCEGDYKNRPMPSELQKKKLEYSRNLLKKDPVEFSDEMRRIACDAIVAKLVEKKIEVIAFAIGRIHVHGIIRCPDHTPRHWIGLAKKHAAFALVEQGLTSRGGVWAKRAECKPIANERHFHRAVQYVLDHKEEGSAVWSASDDLGAGMNDAARTPTESIPWALGDQIAEIVRSHWGYDTLRPLQFEAIRAGLEQRDSLVVLPTGGGKSLCYQVPPLVADRLDVVVSPLISLMRDQVDALTQNGYPAAAVHSNLTPAQRQEVRDGLRRNKYKLLFIAPERVINPEYLQFFDRINVRCFAIDEAHCISQWGHDFRPEYRQLALLKQRFPQASVHAYTATATERVRKDIIDKLSLVNPNVLVGTFDRPNLVYRVLPTVDVYAQTLEAVRRHAREAVIVYCLSRKDTEGMAAFLKANGVSAAYYHAGMESRDRSKVQDAFAREELDVVCATVAFGMGIDRSNVRCVIHASMPKSIEHYQQETGRAGRDGLEAECVLFYSAGDVMRWDGLIQKSAQNAEDPAAVIASGRELLGHIAGFCRSSRCRHSLLSEYFDQAYQTNNCRACDVCLNEVGVMSDSTTIAQKILSCVYRIGQCFGIRYIVEVLRGANTENVRERGHESLSTYGILRELPDKALTQLVYQLVDQGLLEREAGDRPVVRLGAEAMDVLRGEKQVRLVEPAVTISRTAASEESWEGVDQQLFEKLRELRKRHARDRSVPAFVIFSDATLRDMARKRPSTADKMKLVTGVGEKKLADFGGTFLDIIQSHCEETGATIDIFSEQMREYGPMVRPKKGGRGPSRPNPERDEAMKMLREGKSIAFISGATGRADSTIWTYLSQLIAEDPSIDVHHWVDVETYQSVLNAAAGMEGYAAKPVFEALGEQVPYGVIRLVLAHAEAAMNR